MKKKYVCIGGEVISRNDGDRHYIHAKEIAKLYNVNPTDCDFVEAHDEFIYWRSHHMPYDHPNDRPIVLKPRYDGRYDLLPVR